MQFSSKCGNEYAVFFLFLPPLSVTSLLFLSWDLLPSFGSKVQFFKCELTQSQHFKHSWCQCAAWRSSEVLLVSVLYSKLFCSLFRYFCLFDQTAFWFLHVFFFKERLLPCWDVSSPSPFHPVSSPHIDVGGKMSCWLGCWWGSWGFRFFPSRCWSCAFVELCMKSLNAQSWFTQWSSWDQWITFVLSPVSAHTEACKQF